MPVTIAASSSTHFLWNGNPMPRVYRVVPHGALDARLESVDDRTWMLVPLGSAVSGSEPANRDALVAALAGIVSPAAPGGGGGVDPGAVGLAVNAAIRDGGALPVAGEWGASATDINNALKGSAQPITASDPIPISATGIAKDTQLPATLGAKTAAQSVSMTWASDLEGRGTQEKPAIVLSLMSVPMASLTLMTGAYVASRVLADTQPLVGAVLEDGGFGLMTSIRLIDPGAQSAPMTLLFFSEQVSIGSEGAAPSITGQNAMNYLGHVNVTAGHWQLLGGSSVATVACRIGVQAEVGSRDIFVAAINGTNAPTFPGGVIYMQATVEPVSPPATTPAPTLLGPELVVNTNLTTPANWPVFGSDTTHIATFGATGLRYQSDTTTPQLKVFQPVPLTIGQPYVVEIEIGSVTSGSVKLEVGTEILTAGAVGVFTLRVTPTVASGLNITRNSTNVDLVIKRVSMRRVL